jgi:hypothetical protein
MIQGTFRRYRHTPRRAPALGIDHLGVGWYLTVWDGADQGRQTGISYMPMLWRYRGPAAAHKFLTVSPAAVTGHSSLEFRLDRFDPAAQTDVARLASTCAGRIARDLYQRVVSMQGPAGPLRVTEQQKRPRPASRWALATPPAVWSPDGVMSRPGH